jgi:hypothetical protein
MARAVPGGVSFPSDPRRGSIRRMRTVASLFATLGLVLLPPLAPLASADAAADACVKYWGEPRFNGSGYNHLVHVVNSCSAPAACVVTTNVNPEPTALEVAGNSEAVVNTFLGSPARTFAPHVVCTMRSN